MGDEEQATLDGQFYEFAKMMDKKRDGTTITLYFSDFWMRQAKLLDDKKITMTDTGILFNEFSKTELTWDEWLEYLSRLCELKDLNEEQVQETLTNCGLPGQIPVQLADTMKYVGNRGHTSLELAVGVGLMNEMCFIANPGKDPAMDRYDISYCNATHDGFLCWPPTAAGTLVSQNCPRMRLSDPSRFAQRRCGNTGVWLGRRLPDSDEYELKGWTNYSDCFPSAVQSLLTKVFGKMDNENVAAKFDIAESTRTLEIVGFSVSLVSLVISLFIFNYYRVLRNNRTRIHNSLFVAMTIHVLIRLSIYVDQAIVRKQQEYYDLIGKDVYVRGIDTLPFLCESFYVLLEYTTTAMFMWMFIEGLYLHNVVTANPLSDNISHCMYSAIGWGVSLVITSIWVIITTWNYWNDKVNKCWYGYNFSLFYWIVQSPRLAVILCNFVFLVKIMKVLIIKLRVSGNSEMKRIRKAVRAALVLLPLLGITNVSNMINAPLDGSIWKFGMWCYSTHFLRSFQGFFIALIYCFLNGEVRQVIAKHYNDYMAMNTNSCCSWNPIAKWFNRNGMNKRQQEAKNTLELTSRRLSHKHASADSPVVATVCDNNLHGPQNVWLTEDSDCEAVDTMLEREDSETSTEEDSQRNVVQVEVTIHREHE